VLHALLAADAVPLKAWLEISPRNAVTVLDTHDGIGVIDVGAEGGTHRPGLLPPAAIDSLVETIHRNSGGQSRLATGAAASNLDLYQVNCTYYDALGRDDRAYLLARAIQFFAPGVPQVYYTGLLAGTNDVALLARTQVGRDINRHYYSADEIRESLARPVVQGLLTLIRFRNRHPAFGGEFSVLASAAHVIVLEWRTESARARLTIDLVAATGAILATENGVEETIDIAALCPRCGDLLNPTAP
jgi:sucrose phosphorylase